MSESRYLLLFSFHITLVKTNMFVVLGFMKLRVLSLFSCKSLREFRYSHACRHASKNPDFIRSAQFAHELPTASCARAGERAPNRRFVLFAVV